MERKLPFTLESGTVTVAAAALAIIPVLLIPMASIPFGFTKTIAIVIAAVLGLALYILTRLRRGSIIMPPLMLLGVLWGIPAAYLLSAVFSGGNLGFSIFGNQIEASTVGFVLAGTVFASVLALTLRKAEQFSHVIKASFVGVGLVLLAQIIFFILNTGILQGIGVTAGDGVNTLGSISDFAVFLGASVLGILMALLLGRPSKKTKRWLYVFLALSLIFLAGANFTLVWIVLGLFALGVFIHGMLKQSGGVHDDIEGVTALYSGEGEQGQQSMNDMNAPVQGGNNLVLSLIVLAASIIMVIGSSSLGNILSNALGFEQVAVRPSWQATLDVAANAYAQNPIFGTGPTTFGSQWLLTKPAEINNTIFWNVDFSAGIGYVPSMIAVTGILGALAWLAFFVFFIYVGFRALIFSRAQHQGMFALSLGSYVVALYLWTFSVLHVPGPSVLFLAFAMTGIFIATLRFSGNQKREWGIFFSRSPRIGFMLVFTLTLVLLSSIVTIFFAGERYLASVFYNQAVVYAQNGDRAGSGDALNQALTLNQSDRFYRLGAGLGQSDLNTIVNDESLSQEERSQAFQAALGSTVEAALFATQVRGENYQNWLTLGNVYQLVVPLRVEGAYDNAKAAYEEAQKLNPQNPEIPLIMAQLEIANQDTEAARELLQEAISLKQDYVDAIFLLSQLEVQEGNTQEALESAEAAAFFQPNNANILFQLAILREATGDLDGAIAALTRATNVNPSFANGHYVLATFLAEDGQYEEAIEVLNTVASLSEQNAELVADQITALENGENPFEELGGLGQ
ncbi:MAG: tetratricopeptide repeat protein [Patescibacteria group bacterium UBA2103]